MTESSLVLERPSVRAVERPANDVAADQIAVRVRGLVKRYRDGTVANRGIDLDVRRGEVLSILGPNGAGKTTFLRQLTTSLRPTAGTVEIFGIDSVAAPQQAKRLMGITPQEAGVFETLTVREHFEFFARLKGLSKRAAREATAETIHELDLDAEAAKRVGTLSGGQRRRVLVGLALLGKPPLLVLDEPTTGLDPASRHAVWHVIRRAVGEGTTVILSTHYIEEAERLSDRIGIISAGSLIACGTQEELLARLSKSYRLSYQDPLEPFSDPCVRYFATFAEAQRHVAHSGLAEYSIARASLEDVYFTLTGHRFEDEEHEEARR
ncbi:MAG TPA: ABC transporter ATP-binding protein [Pyrinomonadaceae bacterium]|nr:ABC transporter ATP-binding protein [Pyrinomonadaceae bacterium]